MFYSNQSYCSLDSYDSILSLCYSINLKTYSWNVGYKRQNYPNQLLNQENTTFLRIDRNGFSRHSSVN